MKRSTRDRSRATNKAALALLACSTYAACSRAPFKHAAAIDSMPNSPPAVLIARPVSTHARAYVIIIKKCADAWLDTDWFGTDTELVQREQRARRRARCPSLPHTCWAALLACDFRGWACASTVDAIDSAPSTGTGTHLSAVPVDEVHRVQCDAGPPGEPSRRLSPDFRKSLDLHRG